MAVKKADKKSDSQKVDEFMQNLEHPLKAEIEPVRNIILNANSKIAQRVKWNAPSFYYKKDMATFNPRATNHVHIVFHHADVVHMKSDLLQGDYKDRRMVYFRNMQDVQTNKLELEEIMNYLVTSIDKQINV